MDLAGRTLGEKVVAGAGAALAVDLTFLPWHRVNLGIIIVPRTALQWPDAPLGVAALLVAVAMVLAVLTGAGRRRIADHRRWFRAGGLVLAGLLLTKLTLSSEALGYAAYAGVALGAAVASGASLVCTESPAPAPGAGP